MAKQKASELIDEADLTRALTRIVSKSFKEGIEEAFSGKSLLQDLNDQMKEFTKEQNTQKFNDEVRKKSLSEQMSLEKAELEILAERAKSQNNSIIAELQQNAALTERLMLHAELMGNMKAFYGFQEKLSKTQSDIKGLQAQNDSIDEAVKLRKEQLDLDEKRDKLEQKSDRIAEKIKHATHWQHQFKEVTEDVMDILGTPQLAKAIFAEQMVEKIGHVNHAMHEMVDTGMQAGEAINLMREDFSLMSAMGLSKASEVSKDLVANFGTAKVLTEAQRAAVGEMATNYGLAGDEAASLTMAISRMPGESKESATNFAKSADSIGKMKGVLPSQIMKEMAKNAGLMATFSKGGAEGFAQAAASAKKMGVELGSIASAAERVLDFESSINSQMEASVLIGKELNFDRLRQASLAGDLNAVMKEQTKLVQEAGSLDQMNTLQKKALSESLGLTTEELVKMNDAQKFNNQYFGENSTLLDNIIGKTLKVTGGVGGLVKEYGLLALSFIQTLPLMTATIAKLFAKSAATNTDTISTNINTTAQDRSGLAIKRAGMMAKGAAGGMLAMGAAVLMVGAGVGLAAMGLAELTQSFKDLTGEQALGAVASIAIVMGGFVAILYAMTPAIAALGATAGVVTVPLLALGASFLMIGAGIGLAGAGIGYMVEQFGKLPFENLIALPLAFTGIAAGLFSMATAGLVAMPTLLALTGLAAVSGGLSNIGLGGGGGGGEEDPVVKAINKLGEDIRQLKVLVKLDGRGVGDGNVMAANLSPIK